MSSELIVPIVAVEAVVPAQNADALEIVKLHGVEANIVARKGVFNVGDRGVYLGAECLIPEELAEQFNLTKMLGKQGRVLVVKLRGNYSEGVLLSETELIAQGHVLSFDNIGENVAEALGILKYTPPLRIGAEDTDTYVPLFLPYTDIQNLRHYGDILVGQDIIVMEKIHGTHGRAGVVNGEVMCGSSGLRRKHNPNGLYWYPYDNIEGLRMMIDYGKKYGGFIVYGEIYGQGIQSFNYGVPRNVKGFRVFDVRVNGTFLNWDVVVHLCNFYGVEMVPVLYSGIFDIEIIKQLAEGKSALGGSHVREGVVVRCVPEGEYQDKGFSMQRKIFKYHGNGYLSGKSSDYTEE